MAKVKVVKVEKARTINLGNSNFVRFGYGVEAELGEGDDYNQTFDRFNQEVEEKVEIEHGKWWND